MNYKNLSTRPLKLKRNRVWRPFVGGKLLDEWQGLENPQDGNIAEEWVASAIEARNVNPVPKEGLSRVALEEGTDALLRDIIDSSPEDFLGYEHVQKYGSSMAVLVKVLDSYSRLLIQVHPDKEFARNVFNSDFGKTEAWYILGGRKVNGEDPYVLFGFKPGITKEKWRALFEKQDIEGMVECLHKFYVKPGDVFLVEGGVPHAAGAGCFFMEIQEPTDFTIRTEKKSPMGLPITDMQLHQGAGFDKMFDCFHYDGYTREEIMKKWYVTPSVTREDKEGREFTVIPSSYASYFSMNKVEIKKEFKTFGENRFSVVVAVAGKGKIQWEKGELSIKQSEELFLPAGLGDITWVCEGEGKLEIVRCYPPVGGCEKV